MNLNHFQDTTINQVLSNQIDFVNAKLNFGGNTQAPTQGKWKEVIDDYCADECEKWKYFSEILNDIKKIALRVRYTECNDEQTGKYWVEMHDLKVLKDAIIRNKLILEVKIRKRVQRALDRKYITSQEFGECFKYAKSKMFALLDNIATKEWIVENVNPDNQKTIRDNETPRFLG